MSENPLDRLLGAVSAPTPSSERFVDGGSYRIEIPSVEGPEAFATVLEQASIDGITVHRVSQGSGISLLTDAEIAEYVRLGASNNVEVCLFVGPRAPWTGESASALTPDGKFFGWRHLSVGTLKAAFEDVQRAASIGIRSFLVADEGLLTLVDEARRSGELPADVVMKASAILGIANPIGARMLAAAGADSINVPGDCPVRELAAFRSELRAPIDIYIEGPDPLGGFTRYHDIGDIVRFAAPVYLKFGLRNAPGLYPSGRHLLHQAKLTATERVRRAVIGMEHLQRQYPAATPADPASTWGIPVSSTGVKP